MNTIFYIEIAILILIVILQIYFFYTTVERIKVFKSFIPNVSKLQKTDDTHSLILNVIGDNYADFIHILKKINVFIYSNRGGNTGVGEAFSKLLIRVKNQKEDEIESQLAAPLYLGLCGTLVGIVFGLWHLIDATGSADITDLSSEAINGLFIAVGLAIIVSLFGLVLIIFNTNFIYKSAKVEVDKNELDVLSKIEIEFYPSSGDSTATAIAGLRDHLTLFNKEFGRNLNTFKDNFGLINENLNAQEKVLNLLNKSNLGETAKELAVILKDIQAVSENFKVFKDYQTELFKSFESTISISTEYNKTIATFEDFNDRLDLLMSSIESNTQFNKDFSSFLTQNFPDNQSAKAIYAEQWKLVGDKLIKDIAKNSSNITQYFENVSKEVEKFASKNNSFYESFSGFKQAIEVLIKNSELSHKAFESTHRNMKQLNESVSSQHDVFKELTQTLKDKL